MDNSRNKKFLTFKDCVDSSFQLSHQLICQRMKLFTITTDLLALPGEKEVMLYALSFKFPFSKYSSP